MVKADLARDYYGDLELPTNCDVNEVKKQFKKLALTYHPDRNPGRENEVIARFQRIQSAHEVLLDPAERAKYDANRTKNAYASYNGRASGMKGNPWSNVASHFPPPPRPPPAKGPPPSAGAQRYGKFETPRPGGAAKEGVSARTDTFKAWESMRGQSRPKAPERPEPPKRPAQNGRFPVPEKPKGSPKFAGSKDDAFKSPVPPRSRPAEAFGATTTKRDTTIPGFKGFKPSAPGDEQPAPRNAYFTQRTHPPEPPPRKRPESSDEVLHANPPRRKSVTADILEGRTSTPYSMHGGEKFSPFSAHPNRAKSQRVPYETEKPIPRTESDPSMAAPRVHRPSARAHQYTFPSGDDATSSSDESIGISIPHSRRNRNFAQGRGPTGAGSSSWDASKTAQNGHASAQTTPKSKEEETMYAAFVTSFVPPANASSSSKPTVSNSSQEAYAFGLPAPTSNNMRKYATFLSPETLTPSGVRDSTLGSEDEWLARHRMPPSTLNPLETQVRNLIDQLLINKHGSAQNSDSGRPECHGASSAAESPSKKPRLGRKMTPCTCYGKTIFLNFVDDHVCADVNKSSFSMKVDSETFSSTRPPNLTSRSTDSINTKFTPEDWHGQFTAGDYFKPDESGVGGPHAPRTQSGSRARGRSPIKVRYVDPQLRTVPQQHEIPTTPGGTKFSAEEWRETFKSQTFAPPSAMSGRPTRKPRRPSVRATMGTAAVVEDGSSDDTKPLFPKKPPTPASSPDAMDIDTPNPPTPTTSAPIPNANLHVNTRQAPKRPVPTPSGTEEELKVHMDDLALKDVLSTHDLPKPPRAPNLPQALSTSSSATPVTATSPSDQHPYPTFFSRPPSATSISTQKVLKESYIQAFTSYMTEWDLFSNRMLLHIVARKNGNDALASQRWDDAHLNGYRHGVKVDKAVMSHWNECLEKHAGVLRDWAVFREREKREVANAIQMGAGVAGVQAGVAGLGLGLKEAEQAAAATVAHGPLERERPARKKTH